MRELYVRMVNSTGNQSRGIEGAEHHGFGFS
jgi:hypothetical protein